MQSPVEKIQLVAVMFMLPFIHPLSAVRLAPAQILLVISQWTLGIIWNSSGTRISVTLLSIYVQGQFSVCVTVPQSFPHFPKSFSVVTGPVLSR